METLSFWIVGETRIQLRWPLLWRGQEEGSHLLGLLMKQTARGREVASIILAACLLRISGQEEQRTRRTVT